jgi:hypothetical protein
MRTALCLGAALALAALAAPASHAQDVSADPTYGNVRLSAGFLPDPHTVDLTAGGGIAVSMGECSYGHVATAPDVDFYYSGNGRNTLYIYARSGSDTTLLVNQPDGDWVCNDDGFRGSSNPLIQLPGASAGLYNIWVGTYASRTAPATLYISEIDPR